MTTRDHNNRSEKQKGHAPTHQRDNHEAKAAGHQGAERGVDRSGTDERHDGESRVNGGGDGAGGGPRVQGQAEANGGRGSGQTKGHG
jgi:hypothetical protein